MEEKGIIPLMKKLDAKIIDFDDLQRKTGSSSSQESYWRNGFESRDRLSRRSALFTGCLKTHQYGVVHDVAEASRGSGPHDKAWL
jgi:uncharacterized protein (DUF362 family)